MDTDSVTAQPRPRIPSPDPLLWGRWLGIDPPFAGDAKLAVDRVPTSLGEMVAIADVDGLLLLEFCDRPALVTQVRRLVRARGAIPAGVANGVLEATRIQLQEYFAKRRESFTVPLAPVGTEFQQRAWNELRAIGYGQLRTYRRQAGKLGAEGAVRAVGRANGANPISILIPCHRLIGSDGSLRGYGGGLWRKRRLIDLETDH